MSKSETVPTKSHQNQSTFGRYTEIPLAEMTPEQRAGYDYVVKERGAAPGPYKIWVQNPALMTAMVPIGVYFQDKLNLTKAEREIVTNLINGKWLAGYSNYEHEILGEQAGLPPEKVVALIAGLATTFEDARQQVIYDLTLALITPRRVPQGLYQRAIELLGDSGLTDLTVLIGYFTSVSLTLNAYDVQAHEEGLKR